LPARQLYILQQYIFYPFRPRLSRQWIPAIPQWIATKICTQNWGGVKAVNLLSIFFSPTPKKFGEEKTSIFKDCRQLEAYNFETAQHIDKQISDLSSSINALQNGNKLGATTPRGFSAT